MFKKFLSISIIIICGLPAFGQNSGMEKQLLDSLVIYEKSIKINISETKQKHDNERIIRILHRIIKQENSISIDFDTLKFISVLTSTDKKLRVFSWVIPGKQGKFEYFGIVQAYDERSKRYNTIELEDKTKQISNPMKKVLSAEKWYGARYYQLITSKYKGRRYYTLLGWKGIDMTLTSKVVEIMSVKSNGSISFGYNLFEIKNCDYFANQNSFKRLVYIYSAEASMNLVYQKQIILKKIRESRIKKPKIEYGFNSQKKEVRTKSKFRKIDDLMIVMDQLGPLNQEMEGMYAFYIPKINVLDALYFESGKWVYYSDIDARNDGPEKPKKEVIDYDLIEEE